MTSDITLPNPIHWDDTQDVIRLLDWLEAQPSQANQRQLPSDAYSIDPHDTKLRAMGGLLASQKHIGHDTEALALIRKLLRMSNPGAEWLRILMSELEHYETLQRQSSQTQLETFTDTTPVNAVYSPPDVFSTHPYVDVFSTEAGDFGAVFAVEVIGVQPTRYPAPLESACGDLLLALHQAAEHGQNHDGLGLEMRFAWRTISHEQTITIALLVSLKGLDDAERSEQAAAMLWQTIDSVLPLKRAVYSYQPVTDPARLAWLREPGEMASLFAVTRQQELFEFEAKTIYTVQPVGTGEGSHQALLAELLRRPGCHVVDVQFKPTYWRYDERKQVRQMLHISGPDMSVFQRDEADLLLRRMSDDRYRRAVEIHNHMLARDVMFEVHITVASSEPTRSSSLPIVVAQNLFGTSRYDVHPVILPDDHVSVSRHLRDLSGETWPRPQSPSGLELERLLFLWTPDETLSAVRLPTPDALGLPGVTALKMKMTTLPTSLPTEGLLIGDAYDPMLNRVVPIHLNQADRARHMYVVGRTGTGKTTLLENMVLQDIHAGRGVGVVDPHGDLIEAVLARIPPHRTKDVILFDPASADRPVGLNILDVNGEFEKNMMIAEFLGLLYSIYDPGRTGIIGPRFEQAVRNAMHVAMSIKGSTLVDVMRILSDRTYAKACLKFVTDPMTQSYFKDIADGQSDFHRSEVLDYITSKFGRFTGDTAIRSIIGQSKTTMDFGRIMDERKILLVNLSKGRIGQENSRFLGLLLVPRLLIAAFSRAKQPESQRQPFYLYIDEFHNFTTPMFGAMLSEGRKYGLSLTLANQFISQLTDDVREAVFGNVGTLGVFQIGVKDAHLMAQELYPVFNTDDLVNFSAFHMALKMPLGGASGRPFMLKTRASLPNANPALAEAVRQYALLHYGRDTVVIDADIRRRFQQPPEGRE